MPQRSPLARIGAGVLGAGVFLCSAIITVGTSLVAPIGVFVARRVSRGRGRTPSRWTSWIGATIASCVALGLLLGVVFVRVSPQTLRALREAGRADTTVRAAPPPAWVTRMFPQTARRPDPSAERLVRSSAFTGYVLVESAGLRLLMFGVIAGSAGWAGTLLLGYAFGREPSG